MELRVLNILREKVVGRVPTLELFRRYPSYTREITLIALSELPLERLSRLLCAERGVFQEVCEIRSVCKTLGH